MTSVTSLSNPLEHRNRTRIELGLVMSASNGKGVTNHSSSANTVSFTLDSSGGNKSSGSDGGSSKRKAVEITLLTVLCVVIWSLYLLPIIFYHIPVGVDEDVCHTHIKHKPMIEINMLNLDYPNWGPGSGRSG